MGSTLREFIAWEIVQISGISITVGTALMAGVLVLVTLIARRILKRVVRRAFELRGVSDEGTIGLVSNVVGYSVLLVGLGSALSTVGIDLGAVFAAGAVFAVGIGFALQSLAQNFVSGVLLMVERSIKPGDILEVDGSILKVVHLGIRSTIATGRDGENVLIPNSSIVQNTVRNRTHENSQYRVRATVGVSYESDLDAVQEVLTQVASAMDKGFGPPQVLLIGFGASSVDFEVGVWTNDPWMERAFRSQLNKRIWDALKDKDITIAFPQLDVHFDPALVGAISGRTAS